MRVHATGRFRIPRRRHVRGRQRSGLVVEEKGQGVVHGFGISSDTAAFEVVADLDDDGTLTADCAQRAAAVIGEHGLVILTGALSHAEADVGAALVRDTIADPDRSRCAFASETDNRYRRRDFCSLPATPAVTQFAATLCQRLVGILGEYCDRSRPLLEVTTLTSYAGSSHQYIHRDPPGVISLFAAVEDVSERQGGTVFIPGTQLRAGVGDQEDARSLAELFRIRCNWRILAHNLRTLWNMRRGEGPPLAPGEFADRVFSPRWDEHQPNLLRFLLGKNPQFSLRMLGPGTLLRLYRQRRTLDRRFHAVATAPRKGTVIVYLSDMLHAA